MTHRLDIRIYYEDTDMAGIVYHANYLKFLERGRSEAVRAAGIDQAELLRDLGLAFVVRAMEIAFLRPALYDDYVSVHSTVMRIGGASVIMEQAITRDKETIFTAMVRLALIGRDGLPQRLPAAIRASLGKIVSE